MDQIYEVLQHETNLFMTLTAGYWSVLSEDCRSEANT